MPPTTTEAFRLYDKDSKGDTCSRCIFNNFASFLDRSSFYVVAFFGRRAPLEAKKNSESKTDASDQQEKHHQATALDSAADAASSEEEDVVLKQILQADDDLTQLMAIKPELHER